MTRGAEMMTVRGQELRGTGRTVTATAVAQRETAQRDTKMELLWNRSIEHAEQLADIDKIKEAYEALLEAYPNTVSHVFLSAVIVY